MRLTHRMIEVFRALVQTGNATRTAELLHTSQPSISRDLARLEQVTGMMLFERRGGRLYPSARALALFDEVQRSFLGLGAIAARAEVLRTLGEGQIHIAALPCLCDALLPPVCRRFAERFPDISLRIEAMESPGLENALMNQQVDLGLVEHLDPLPGVGSELVFEDDELVLVPARHPLARKKRLSPADFEGQPFVSFAPQDAYRQRTDALFLEQGVSRKQVIETSTASSVCAFVENGLGLAIVNPVSARLANSLKVSVRPFSVSIPYHVGLARPERRPPNPAADHFVEILKAELSPLASAAQIPEPLSSSDQERD